MKSKKITPVERVWRPRDSVSKRPEREEIVPNIDKKKSFKKQLEEKAEEKSNVREKINRNPIC